jgi:hypothetical protein
MTTAATLEAFSYLTWHTLKNRTWTRIRRARNPRYAISAVIGAVYFWFFLIRNPSRLPTSISAGFNDIWVVVATLGLLIFASTWWLFGGDKTTLAFSMAETSFLFPAPLSRRAVIGYKLFRAQLTILINALIFIFLMRRGVGFLPSQYRAISLWMLFTTLNFHRIGAALVRTNWVENKRHALRQAILPTLVFGAILVAMILGLMDLWPNIVEVHRNHGFFEAVGEARRALDTAPTSWVLWPARAVVAPVFATSPTEWRHALPSAFLVLLLHAWWVVRTDAAFEEAAIAASNERVRRIEAWRSRRMSAPEPKQISRSALVMPSAGHPAVAIVWKNILCLRRTMQLRIFIAPLIMAVTWGWAFGSEHGVRGAIAIGAVTLAALLTFFGPMLIRNDLRQDMQNLIALKVLPLTGRMIVMAEVMSSALPIAATQFVILLIAAFFARVMDNPVPVPIIAGVLAAALPGLIAVATLMVSVQNGAPVLFPGWVRIGTVVGGGMENLGQGVMSMGIMLILVALLLIPVALVVIVAYWLLNPFSAGLAMFAGILTGSITLAVESFGVFSVLGRALDRTEPSETAFAS